MSMRLKRVAARGAKRLLAILLMAAFAIGSAGVPVVSRVAKDRSRPFPCQDNACGCASADECWHHCCCHSNCEKVAWAKEHGVTPPDFVIAAADKEEKEETSAAHVCCHCHHACEKCAAQSCAHCEPSKAAGRPAAKKLRMGLVLFDLARHCRSLPQFWSLLGLALPVRIETAWSFDQSIVGRVDESPMLKWQGVLSPPVPPPKLSGPAA